MIRFSAAQAGQTQHVHLCLRSIEPSAICISCKSAAREVADRRGALHTGFTKAGTPFDGASLLCMPALLEGNLGWACIRSERWSLETRCALLKGGNDLESLRTVSMHRMLCRPPQASPNKSSDSGKKSVVQEDELTIVGKCG